MKFITDIIGRKRQYQEIKKFSEQNQKKAIKEIENKKKFCEKCIKVAFKDGDELRDISKVYPKYNAVNKKVTDTLSEKIKGYLFLAESSNNIEIKKHNTKNIIVLLSNLISSCLQKVIKLFKWECHLLNLVRIHHTKTIC